MQIVRRLRCQRTLSIDRLARRNQSAFQLPFVPSIPVLFASSDGIAQRAEEPAWLSGRFEQVFAVVARTGDFAPQKVSGPYNARHVGWCGSGD